jgi:hypothetical protein
MGEVIPKGGLNTGTMGTATGLTGDEALPELQHRAMVYVASQQLLPLTERPEEQQPSHA